MNELICIVSFSKGWLDDDYYLYRSGDVRHIYDQSPFNANLEKIYTVNELSNYLKDKLVKNCKPENRQEVEELLYNNIQFAI